MRTMYARMLEKGREPPRAHPQNRLSPVRRRHRVHPFLGTEFRTQTGCPLAVVDITLPEGMVLSETDHIARQVDIFLKRPEVITCGSMVGITVDAKYAAAQG